MPMETRIADYLGFLSDLGAADVPYFLEGGQAVNFWAEYFSNKLWMRLRTLYQTELSFESSPTLFNGKAYVAEGCGRIYAPSKDGYLY